MARLPPRTVSWRQVAALAACAPLALGIVSCQHPSVPPPSSEWHTLVIGLCEDYPEESRSIEAARRDLQRVRDAGAGVLRISFGWDAMEPEDDRFDWSFWDDVVPMAVEEFGLRLIPYVCYTPRWAAVDDGEDHWRSPPRASADFADFVLQLSRRYGKWIDTWELWNEPDNPAYWLGTPAEFAELTRAGSAAVREGDPTAKVVLGGLAGELDFLDALFRTERVAPAVDIVNFHSYFETWHPGAIEQVTDEIERARDIVRAFGENEPLWMAEVGYSSVGPRPKTSDVYWPRHSGEHTPEAQANAFLRYAILIAASRELEVFAWYRLNDLPPLQDVIGDDNNRHLGLYATNDTGKPVLQAFHWFAELFRSPYRLQPISLIGPADTAVQAHLFEFKSGRRILFAWLAGSGTRAENDPVREDARIHAVELRVPLTSSVRWLRPGEDVHLRPPERVQDADGTRLSVELRGSRVIAIELGEAGP